MRDELLEGAQRGDEDACSPISQCVSRKEEIFLLLSNLSGSVQCRHGRDCVASSQEYLG